MRKSGQQEEDITMESLPTVSSITQESRGLLMKCSPFALKNRYAFLFDALKYQLPKVTVFRKTVPKSRLWSRAASLGPSLPLGHTAAPPWRPPLQGAAGLGWAMAVATWRAAIQASLWVSPVHTLRTCSIHQGNGERWSHMTERAQHPKWWYRAELPPPT